MMPSIDLTQSRYSNSSITLNQIGRMCVWSIVYSECHHLKNEHVFRGKQLFPGVHDLYLGQGTSNLFLNSRILLKNIFPKHDRLCEDRSRNKHGRSLLSGKDWGDRGRDILEFFMFSIEPLTILTCLSVALCMGPTENKPCFREH